MSIDGEPSDIGSETTERRKLGGGAIASLSGVAVLAIFMIQNTDDVTVEFLFWKFTCPIWLLVLAAASVGALGVARARRVAPSPQACRAPSRPPGLSHRPREGPVPRIIVHDDAAATNGPTRPRIERSPADIVRLLVAGGALIALLVVEWLFGDTLVGFASDLLRGLDAVPAWMIDVVVVGTRILAVVVLGGGLVVACRAALADARDRRRRGAAGRALVALVEPLIDRRGTALVDVGAGLGPLSGEGFPTVWGIAAVAAVLTAAAPWLSRRWRRVGWVLLVGMMRDRLHGLAGVVRLARGAVVGWVCGAAVLVAAGAPSRRPTRQAVVDGLSSVGLSLQQPPPGRRRRPRVDALLRRRRQRRRAVRQGARRGRAQRRPAVPSLPARPAPRSRRREALLHPAPRRRARGPRRPRRT